MNECHHQVDGEVSESEVGVTVKELSVVRRLGIA